MITYTPATVSDVETIHQLCKELILAYEDTDVIDLNQVLQWARRKIENDIASYTAVYVDGQKAGYYHFYQNEDGEYELDDLYILPAYRNRGIGTAVIQRCCASVTEPVMLYVFIRNERAVSLYKRLGFEVESIVHATRYIMRRAPRKYYEAYEERYKTAHALGVSWESPVHTPIVLETLDKYLFTSAHRLLEIGCGEGRDAAAVLEHDYDLLATDISREAITYCQKAMPQYANHFRVLNCLSDTLDESFDFIFGIAVLHMLVLDKDREGFYRFIHNHLRPGGLALICTMGDGEHEYQSDIATAFTLQERDHPSGKMMVAGTSCRMVSWTTLKREIDRSGLTLIEQGMTTALPNFDRLMYAVVQK